MSQKPVFIHPTTLERGKIYLRKNGGQGGHKLLPVQFIEYSACPAIVIILDGGRSERCPRADIYLVEQA